MIIAARHSPELGIADYLVEDYVDGLRDIGWNVEFARGRGHEAGVAVFYHPYQLDGVRRDLASGIPIIIIQDSVGHPEETLEYSDEFVKHIPSGLTRDQTVDMMDQHLSAFYGGRNA